MSAASGGGGGGGTTTLPPPSSGGATDGPQESVSHKLHLPWWPEGEPGKLRDAARAYRAAATALTDAGEAGQRGISDIVASNTGGAIDAMAAKWSGTYYGRSRLAAPAAGAPAIDNAVATCLLLAQACEDYAQHIDDARHKLEELAAELVAGLVVGGLLTFVTAGLSDAAAAANAARIAAEALELADTVLGFVNVAFRIGGLALQGAIVGAGSDLAMQTVRISANEQQGLDFGEIGESAAIGTVLNPALAGAGTAAGRGLTRLGQGLKGTASDIGAGARAFGRGFPELLPKPALVTPEGAIAGGPTRSLKDLMMEARDEVSRARALRTEKELEDLARDPAHGNRLGPKGEAEREAGLGLEERGDLPGPITRDPRPDGGEFIDGTGQPWDVKRFNSNFRNGYSPERAEQLIGDELAAGEHVILDTRDLSPADLASLRRLVEENGWGGDVLWWP